MQIKDVNDILNMLISGVEPQEVIKILEIYEYNNQKFLLEQIKKQIASINEENEMKKGLSEVSSYFENIVKIKVGGEKNQTIVKIYVTGFGKFGNILENPTTFHV